MNKIKVLIADDHTIVRQGLRRLIEEQAIEVVGEAEDGEETLRKTLELKPDVVIMDISMPLMRGIEATRRIKREALWTKVIILTIHGEENYLFEALEAGADGYVVKGEDVAILMQAIEKVMAGEFYLSPEIPGEALEHYRAYVRSGRRSEKFSRLTLREREILQLIAEGFTSREIAEKKFISVKTVENHRANIMNKLNIHETAGLVLYAVQIGLIEVDGKR